MRSLSLIFLALIVAIFAKEQSIRVHGQVVCNNRTFGNVLVDLREHDIIGSDDSLASMQSNSNGLFDLSGKEDEVAVIKPYVRITHTCNISKPGCYRLTDFEIPANKINGDYDMKFVELNIGGKEVCK